MEAQTNKPVKILKRNNKLMKRVIIPIAALLLIYLGVSLYFLNHFSFGSVINGINVSGKTVEQADKKITSEINAYTLEVKQRGGVKEKVSSSDVGLKYNSKEKVRKLKDDQNAFMWIFKLFSKDDSKKLGIVSYDDEKLNNVLDNLYCSKSGNIVEPKNAQLEYTKDGYKIKKEVNGNKVNKESLLANVKKAIEDSQKSVDLEALNCYEKPKYVANSKKVLEAKKLLDKYVGLKITYNSANKKVVLDGDTIHEWLSTDKNFEVNFDSNKVKKYVKNELGKAYNTYGKTRNFKTSVGKTVKVSGGDYGYLIDTSKETREIIKLIKEGKDTSKKPTYKYTAKSSGENDIGNTYVEINLTKQHLWFYKNGSLVTEGNVVTGNINKGHATPAGVYRLKYKEKNATLKGDNYSTPVSFWMPFNGGIGIHDANWRSQFGGNIYVSGGSHGCINSPYQLASAIFQNISANTPVVCYNE